MLDLETKFIKSLIDEIEISNNELNKAIIEINKDYQNKYNEVTRKIFNNISKYCKDEYTDMLKSHDIISDTDLNGLLVIKLKENLENPNDENHELMRNSFSKCVDKNFGINKSILLFEVNMIKSDNALFDCVNSIYLKESRYISEFVKDKTKIDLNVNKDIKLKLSNCYQEYYKEVYTLYSESLNNLIKINNLIYLFSYFVPQNISVF